VAAVPRLLAGPCLLNVVRGGKTPEVALRDAEGMGYKLAIIPALLLNSVIAACEAALEELRSTGRYARPLKELTVREAFARVGADEWEALPARFSEAAEAAQ
jgi:2-methylisocitrate lyase-like PEP mutase family enzyme